ncbi:MAG: ABC transporter substrate-binding protein [Candidatus Nomurabacteria bacterium]|jgi:peptide/nickel transport system substrate-binding protein|nr:ABC transporter substrate-binding protein [Candidatus Nomurabacteria bacterium]
MGKRKALSFTAIWRWLQKRADNVEQVTSRHSTVFFRSRADNLREIRGSLAIWLGLFGLLIVIVLSQALVYGVNFQTQTGGRGGVYAEGIIGEVKSFNPILATTEDEKAISKLVYGSLLRIDGTNNLGGDIAETWLPGPDGLSYDVRIKNHVRWQGSDEVVTVDDVLFTINLIQNPQINSPLYDTWRAIEVEKIDNLTLRFKLRTALASFPQVLTFGVLPKQDLVKVEIAGMREHLTEHVVRGSGPYSYRNTVIAQSKNTVYGFVANDGYHRGAPKIASIHIESYADNNSLVGGFNDGEVNMATGLALPTAQEIAKSNDSAILTTPLDSGVFALFNTTTGVTSDKAVRQALRLAVDRDAVRASARVGERLPGVLETPIAPGIYTTVDNAVQPIYNFGEAAKALNSAGWAIGRDKYRTKSGQPLSLNVVTVKDSDYVAAANSLVEQWRAIGIDAKLTMADAETFQQNYLIPRSYDVLVYQLQLGADADEYVYWHSSNARAQGLNLSNYTSPVADLALTRGRAQADEAARETQYKSFVNAWLDDAPAVALYQANFYSLQDRAVRAFGGFTLATEADRYRDVVNWTVSSTTVNKTP